MNRRIDIERVVEVLNAVNEPIETWQKYHSVWADVRPQRAAGGEIFRDSETVSFNRTVFIIRWLDGVTNKMRIKYDGDYYDIKTSAELGRREGLEIMGELVEG